MAHVDYHGVAALFNVGTKQQVGKERFSRSRFLMPGHSLKNGPAQRRTQDELIPVGTDALVHGFVGYVHVKRDPAYAISQPDTKGAG